MEYVSTTQIQEWYGDPCHQPIVTVRLAGSNVHVNKKLKRAFLFMEWVFENTAPKYWKNDLNERHLDDWGYNCRRIAGSSTWSKHAWGIAVDLDADENAQGVPPQQSEIWHKGKRAVLILEHAFTWGGRFSYPDPHHFEAARPPRWYRRRIKRNGVPRRWWKKKLGL